MIDLYTWPTPNGRKVSIMLEECSLPYEVHPVNIREGAQFKPEFVAICPNGKIPAIVDRTTGLSIFESGAILIHLAEQTGKFLPKTDPARARVLEWLMFQMANVGPIFGQVNHFINAAPEKIPYAIERYVNESVRILKVLDGQLGRSEYVAGDYSIADIANYPWVSAAVAPLRSLKADALGEARNLQRWIAALGARPAVQKGMAVPKL
jgi:GST-like protein